MSLDGQDNFLESIDLQRRSTAEQVADALRAAIFAGQLPPGSHLREAVLADAFGVSRNTVRSAIQTLDRDGLVSHRLHRGAYVTELDPEAIADVYATRRLVELSALETVPPADGLRPLEAALADLRRAIDASDDVEIRDADLEFHRAIAVLRGSPRLFSLFEEMEVETRLSTLLVGNVHPDPEGLYQEHARILELLSAGEMEEARSLLDQHLRKSESMLIEAVARRPVEVA